ncbi:MAG: leucine-rich repeat domain-containing protein [Verrucomicrobiota bacterium]|nr:leucine-rich repeat domain-containing protein [Verrucomicrobiota bacterium]
MIPLNPNLEINNVGGLLQPHEENTGGEEKTKAKIIRAVTSFFTAPYKAYQARKALKIQRAATFEQQLNEWVNEKPEEVLSRSNAARKIRITFREKCERLSLFSFDGSKLTSLPKCIGQLTHLKELYLENNQLTALPPEIGQLTHLKELDLLNNQLTALPPEIGQLTHLKELYLGNNRLAALPAEIGQLTHLKELYLGNNQLTALPAEIGQLTHLKELDLLNNQLAALPPEIGQLTQLKTLDLLNNQLAALPAEIGQLTHLKKLYLGNNQLTALPAEIGQLTHLKKLYLGNNQLTALPAEIGQLARLKMLYLNHNQLAAYPTEINPLHLFVLELRENPFQADRPVRQRVDVHEGNRDQKTLEAIKLLLQHQGKLSADEIEKAKDEFIGYLDASLIDEARKELARGALLKAKEKGEVFGPLIDKGYFTILGSPMTGKELIGRLWIFSSQLKDSKDQTSAKNGMIFALQDSYDDFDGKKSRVCNQGKTQRLAVAVLQGRLVGVNIDRVPIDLPTAQAAEVPTAQALTMFFANPANQAIDKKDVLMIAVNQFCNQNPAVNRDTFIEEINKYAKLQEME